MDTFRSLDSSQTLPTITEALYDLIVCVYEFYARYCVHASRDLLNMQSSSVGCCRGNFYDDWSNDGIL